MGLPGARNDSGCFLEIKKIGLVPLVKSGIMVDLEDGSQAIDPRPDRRDCPKLCFPPFARIELNRVVRRAAGCGAGT